jgi:hypothetical protein
MKGKLNPYPQERERDSNLAALARSSESARLDEEGRDKVQGFASLG